MTEKPRLPVPPGDTQARSTRGEQDTGRARARAQTHDASTSGECRSTRTAVWRRPMAKELGEVCEGTAMKIVIAGNRSGR